PRSTLFPYTTLFRSEDQLPFVQADPDPLPRDARHLGGQEDGGLGEDHIDQRIARPDLLALQGGPRGLEARLAGAGRESVDERFTEDAELPLERILQHAVKRAPGLLEFVLYAHGGIIAFLIRTAWAHAIRPQPTRN